MARKRKFKRNPLDYIALPSLNLDPDIKMGIFIVLILAFGAISLLSLFDLAGGLGVYLQKGMMLAFGWGKWLFPFILLALGFALYSEDRFEIRSANYLGLFLFILSFHSLLQLFVAQDQWQTAVHSGAGGGYIGLFLASGLIKLMGFLASLIAVVCLILISLMLMFNAPLARLIGRESLFSKLLYPINFVFNKIFRRGEEEEDEEEDESDEEEDGEKEGEEEETAEY